MNTAKTTVDRGGWVALAQQVETLLQQQIGEILSSQSTPSSVYWLAVETNFYNQDMEREYSSQCTVLDEVEVRENAKYDEKTWYIELIICGQWYREIEQNQITTQIQSVLDGEEVSFVTTPEAQSTGSSKISIVDVEMSESQRSNWLFDDSGTSMRKIPVTITVQISPSEQDTNN